MKKIFICLAFITNVFCDSTSEVLEVVKAKCNIAGVYAKSDMIHGVVAKLIKDKKFSIIDLISFYEYMSEVDHESRETLKGLIYESGWPKVSVFGEKACSQVWVVVLRSSKDITFQRYCLSLLETAWKDGEAKGEWYATLYDTIAVAEGRPQKYGTKLQNNGDCFPIEDKDNLNKRRGIVGLNAIGGAFAC